MNNKIDTPLRGLRSFMILWSTQMLSALGSEMTRFALIIWSYQQEGSALTTALLSVCSYAPYVVMSIFAGALSDRWSKKAILLASDSVAAVCTVLVLLLLRADGLAIWHLYALNIISGLMNTVQQPAADLAVSLLVPKEQYQRVSGMRSFSNALVSLLAPALATAVLTLAGLQAVLMADLLTFAAAFCALLFFVRIPRLQTADGQQESVLRAAAAGLRYLKTNRGILDLIFFLAAINFVASIYQAALPAMLLSRPGGGEAALGILNAVTGGALLIGSVLASALPAPKSRVRVICNTLLLSMSTENFCLALGQSLPVWCVGAALGWLCIPVMNANLDVVLRSRIPIAMQGRVFSARNTLQFFTIPVGYLLGGILVDRVFEPFMARQSAQSFWTAVFGAEKGAGAALLFFVIAVLGVLVCIAFRKDPHIWALEK